MYLISFCLAAIVIADLFLQLIPIWIFAILIFSFQIFYCNRYENAFIFIPFAPVIAGAIFISQGIFGIGGFFIPIGLLLIWKDIIKERTQLMKGYIPLFLIFILFSISAYYTTVGDYYAKKLFNTVTYGTLSYISFSILFINRGSIRFGLLASIFILWGAFLLRFVIDINNLPGPSNLFHFGFMREQTEIFGADPLITIDDFSVSYHLPGFLALIGTSMIFIDSEKHGNILKGYILIFSLIIIFYTGARQNLFAYIILLMFIVVTLKGYSLVFKSLAIGTIGIISILILLSINSDVIQNVLFSNSISGAIEVSGRSGLISRGLDMFKNNPIWGMGFGHYSYTGAFDEYPHNIIIELLAEIGIIGVSFIILLSCYSIFKSGRVLLILHKHNFKPYILLLPFLIRAMISSNMTKNIIVFSFIFSLGCLIIIPQEENQNTI